MMTKKMKERIKHILEGNDAFGQVEMYKDRDKCLYCLGDASDDCTCEKYAKKWGEQK